MDESEVDQTQNPLPQDHPGEAPHTPASPQTPVTPASPPPSNIVAIQPPDGHDFAWALDSVRNGERVTRTGWTGNATLSFHKPTHRAENGRLYFTHIGDSLQLTSHLGTVLPFAISQEDLLATDWVTVEEPQEEEAPDPSR